ncbi:hypothetical protein J6590_014859 [Homalodisca vitripennis]|nr:hypothetical protein J6590_014859 [Homalodisca vitripennis]
MNIKFSLNQSMLTDVTDLMTLIQENCGGKLRFSCTKCGRQYNRKDNLQRHVRFECGKEPQFKCPHCDHKTKQSGNMKTHIILKHPHQLNKPGYKVVHEAGKSKFVCLPCGRSYSRKPNLNQHQRYQCGKEPQFSCPWCPHRTWTKGNLKAHMGAKHTQNILEKDALDRASRRLLGIHICGGCGKKYSRKDNMTRHQRYECNMDPQFACPHCPYKAKQKGTLKSHMYSKHGHLMAS